METRKKTAAELLEILECFTGTFAYHTHRIGNFKLLLTDGCDYIRQEAEAFWLFDCILSQQTRKTISELYHQVWRLKKQNDDSWHLTCEDGNNNLIAVQEIEYSDFPLSEMTIWVIDGVAMLPSEY